MILTMAVLFLGCPLLLWATMRTLEWACNLERVPVEVDETDK